MAAVSALGFRTTALAHDRQSAAGAESAVTRPAGKPVPRSIAADARKTGACVGADGRSGVVEMRGGSPECVDPGHVQTGASGARSGSKRTGLFESADHAESWRVAQAQPSVPATPDVPRRVPVLPADFRLPGDLRWIVLASRLNGETAIGIARGYALQFPNVQVVLVENGRYAVVVGPEHVTSPNFKDDFIRTHGAPKDTFLTRGDKFVARAWRHRHGVLAHASLDETHHAVSIRNGELNVSLTVEPTGNQDESTVAMVGRLGQRVVFTARSEDIPSANPKADIRIVHLDPTTDLPQAVFTYYAGGAHCCTATMVATDNRTGAWEVVSAGSLDGDIGYTFEDIDEDGASEMLGGDNRFLYRFEPYAGSRMPARIMKLIRGRVVDVTHRPEYIRYHRQYLAVLEDEADGSVWRSNGFLAAWVAQKFVVGEGREAWSRMLRLYDRDSDWELFDCATPMPAAECPEAQKRRVDFPTALRKFLDEIGYTNGAATGDRP